MDLISGLRDSAAKQSHAVHSNIVAAFSLEGRTAVVTGAAKGIGRQTAVTLAEAGASVVLADVDVDLLAETAGLVEAVGATAVTVATDVAVREQVDDLARAAVRATGRVDVWANVAAIITNCLVTDATEADVDAVIAVNLKGTFWGCAAAGRLMRAAGRGAIVNVASSGGEMPAPTVGIYGMTKAGVIHLTRTVAAELGGSGVRCNAVAPGYVETPMTQRVWTAPDGTVDEEKRTATLGQRSAMSPLRRNGTPSDIAHAILYLASDASAFTTGQVLRPNGGVYMA